MKINSIRRFSYEKIINRFERSVKPEPKPSKFMLLPRTDNRKSKVLCWA